MTARLPGRVRLRRVHILAVAAADRRHLLLAGADRLALGSAHGKQGEDEYECEGTPGADADDEAGGGSVGQGLDLRAYRKHQCPFVACAFRRREPYRDGAHAPAPHTCSPLAAPRARRRSGGVTFGLVRPLLPERARVRLVLKGGRRPWLRLRIRQAPVPRTRVPRP